MRVKLFEAWNKRYPKSISMDDWSKKSDEWVNGNSEPFDETENKFISKLMLDNKKAIYRSEILGSSIEFGLYPSEEEDDIRYIEIYKMKDSWYLLVDFFAVDCELGGYYLCDEFEEVEGYIGSETTLQF